MIETAELIPVKFEKIRQSKTYTCIVLGTEEKKIGIYADTSCGKTLQQYLTETDKARPGTHDLVMMMCRGFEIKIKQIVINNLDDTLYFARVFFEQKQGEVLNIVEIDARPSDCVILALISHAPLYCTKEVLEQAVALVD